MQFKSNDEKKAYMKQYMRQKRNPTPTVIQAPTPYVIDYASFSFHVNKNKNVIRSVVKRANFLIWLQKFDTVMFEFTHLKDDYFEHRAPNNLRYV